MNAVDNATLERIYFQGKRQRKYISKISEVAQELADLVIERAVSCEDSQGVYWVSFTEDDNVTDCEIRQSDYIMSISMISLGASPAYWPRNYYKLGKTITQYIVDAITAKQVPSIEKEAQSNQDATEESEAPAKQWNEMTDDEQRNAALQGDLYELVGLGLASPDLLERSALVEVPDILAENRKRIELLEARIAKLEGDLEAAGNIIIEAGKQVEKKSRSLLDAIEENVKLKKDNERMMEVIDILASLDLINDGIEMLSDEQNWEVWATLQVFKEDVLRKQSASTEAPQAETVTLSEKELDWLARYDNNAHELMTWAIRNTPKNQRISAHEYYHGLLNRKDTPANRAAIAARRKELAQS